MEVWTDISHFDGQTAGAYIVNDEPARIVELSGNLQGTRAETALMEHVIDTLQVSFILHHDVANMPILIASGRVPVLQRLADQYLVELRPDGRQFKKYRMCHHAARVAVGIFGSKHPLLLLSKQVSNSETDIQRTMRLQDLRRRNARVTLKGGLD